MNPDEDSIHCASATIESSARLFFGNQQQFAAVRRNQA
jgi:hypothetical protein